MGYRSSIQLLLIIISIVIISTYVNPEFETLKKVQDETVEYETALKSAESFNQELQKLIAVASRLDTEDMVLLDRYIPEVVDTVAVMRDVETIVANNNMSLSALESGESGKETSRQVASVQGQTQSFEESEFLYVEQFTISIIGTYNQFKLLLQDFEKNIYPLEVASIFFTPGEGTLYTFDLSLETYSFNSNELKE